MSRSRSDRDNLLDQLLAANRAEFEQLFKRRRRGAIAEHPVTAPLAAEPAPIADRPPAAEHPPALPLAALTAAAVTPPRSALSVPRLAAALSNACAEMDAVYTGLARPAARVEGGLATLTDPAGLLLAGAPVAATAALLGRFGRTLTAGDLLLQADPRLGSSGQAPGAEWLLLLPVFAADGLIGASVMRLPLPGTALRVPPVKLYQGGEPNPALLDVLLHNLAAPQFARRDLDAALNACQTGADRLTELAARAGSGGLRPALDALLNRDREALRERIAAYLPLEPRSHQDGLDVGEQNTLALKLTVWREDDRVYCDWSGSAAQAQQPLNFTLDETLFKTLLARRLRGAAADPAISAGGHELLRLSLPQGLLRPPAAAGQGRRVLTAARVAEMLDGALARCAAELGGAAGGTPDYLIYRGDTNDTGTGFALSLRLPSGPGGRPGGRTGRADLVSLEELERRYPLRVEGYAERPGGGAGAVAGSGGLELTLRLLAAGRVELLDGRRRTPPPGARGGAPGEVSLHRLEPQGDIAESLPADRALPVQPGDRLVLRSAAGGGWGEPPR